MPQEPIDYAAPSPHRVKLSKRKRRTLRFILAAFAFYVGSYVCLSKFGRFYPATMAAYGVRAYRWAPAGIVTGFRCRWGLFYFYAPLYLADRNCWHRDRDAYTGKYPTTSPTS